MNMKRKGVYIAQVVVGALTLAIVLLIPFSLYLQRRFRLPMYREQLVYYTEIEECMERLEPLTDQESTTELTYENGGDKGSIRIYFNPDPHVGLLGVNVTGFETVPKRCEVGDKTVWVYDWLDYKNDGVQGMTDNRDPTYRYFITVRVMQGDAFCYIVLKANDTDFFLDILDAAVEEINSL